MERPEQVVRVPWARGGRRWGWRRLACLGMAVCCVALGVAAGAQSLSDAQRKAEKEFLNRANDYLGKEHQLPASKWKPTADIAQLEQNRQSLRSAVQALRPDAKQGDIFTPEVADVFRLLLGATMAGEHGGKIRASLAHAEPIAPSVLKVNTVYPNTKGQPLQSVPPTLLRKLPVLPKGLEYRVAGRTLALRDTEANLVVDYLPDALP